MPSNSRVPLFYFFGLQAASVSSFMIFYHCSVLLLLFFGKRSSRESFIGGSKSLWKIIPNISSSHKNFTQHFYIIAVFYYCTFLMMKTFKNKLFIANILMVNLKNKKTIEETRIFIKPNVQLIIV